MWNSLSLGSLCPISLIITRIFNVFCRRVSSCSDSYVEISRRKLNAENREQLKSAIINCDFSSIMNRNSVETSYNMFAGVLKTLYDTQCPFNNTRVKRLDVSKPFITSEIKCMLKLKHKLQKIYNIKPITHGSEY